VGTDVDGIFDSDPRTHPGAHLISVIDESNEAFVRQGVGPSSSIDVTGGMMKKMGELIEAAKHGVSIVIFNLTVEGRLESLLRGESAICTKIVMKSPRSRN